MVGLQDVPCVHFGDLTALSVRDCNTNPVVVLVPSEKLFAPLQQDNPNYPRWNQLPLPLGLAKPGHFGTITMFQNIRWQEFYSSTQKQLDMRKKDETTHFILCYT